MDQKNCIPKCVNTPKARAQRRTRARRSSAVSARQSVLELRGVPSDRSVCARVRCGRNRRIVREKSPAPATIDDKRVSIGVFVKRDSVGQNCTACSVFVH
ncbi:hypothetical protein EVAR_5791_1 [Eumeta japonica]|uniref:Uncharacterized protein n=1 Tax=Eumeta variegata TaxID=151549 RepID=A0A4C1T568_EUMVA|nr:hypothetical protein EVAR_5791_1 [Eumeta japonica]